MRPGALTHPEQLVQRDIEAEEELQCVFGDGSGACEALGAAVQSQGLAHLFEHELLGDVVADGGASNSTVSAKANMYCNIKHGRRRKRGKKIE